MSSIGKSSRIVNRVKSVCTLTGPKTSASSVSPKTPVARRNSQIPISNSPATPVTCIERKKYLTRRKLPAGDGKPQLTVSTPNTSVMHILYKEQSHQQLGAGSCDLKQQGDGFHPNCAFMNVCRVQDDNTYSKELLKLLITVLALLLRMLLVVALISTICFISWGTVHWLCGGMFADYSEEVTPASEDTLEEPKPDPELNTKLVEVKSSSIMETHRHYSMVDLVLMTLGEFFSWFANILLPSEE